MSLTAVAPTRQVQEELTRPILVTCSSGWDAGGGETAMLVTRCLDSLGFSGDREPAIYVRV